MPTSFFWISSLHNLAIQAIWKAFCTICNLQAYLSVPAYNKIQLLQLWSLLSLSSWWNLQTQRADSLIKSWNLPLLCVTPVSFWYCIKRNHVINYAIRIWGFCTVIIRFKIDLIWITFATNKANNISSSLQHVLVLECNNKLYNQ